MSWTLAGSKKASTGLTLGPVSAAFVEAVATGDLVVVAANCYVSPTQGTVTVTDSAGGNTWTQRAKSAVGGNNWSAILSSVVVNGAAAGAFQVNVSFSNQQFTGIAYLHYTNPAGTISFDTSNTATGSGTSAAATIATAAAGELVVITAALATSLETYTPSTGFAAEQSGNSGSNEPFCTADNLSAPAGSITPSIGLSATSAWAFCAAAFAAAGGAVVVHRLPLLGAGN